MAEVLIVKYFFYKVATQSQLRSYLRSDLSSYFHVKEDMNTFLDPCVAENKCLGLSWCSSQPHTSRV